MKFLMNYPGVPGSVTGKYREWIELVSLDTLIGVRGGSTGATPPARNQFTVTKKAGSETGKLLESFIKGEQKTVEFVVLEDSGLERMRIMLNAATISSYTVTGSSNSAFPFESLSLVYGSMTVSYGDAAAK